MRALKCSSGFWPSFSSLSSDLRLSKARRARRRPGRVRTGLAQTYKVGAPSVFVTGIAWLFIVLAALASVVALLPGIAAVSLWPVGLVLSGATLASAIGLLLRLDWARRSVIGLLVLAIAANLGGVWLQHEVVHGFLAHGLTQLMLPLRLIEGLVAAARWVGVLVALLGCGLLGWVIRGLMVTSVRQEFA